MTTIIGDIKSKYDEMIVGIDPEIDNWLFMKSPLPVLGIILIYLYFVLKLGPQIMASRKAFHMKKLLVFYNFYQVIFSTWLCFQAVQVDNTAMEIFKFVVGIAIPNDRGLVHAAWRASWWYFFSKLVELLDTVFFVLRKKQNQISFLHVYHHSLTALGSWWHLKYLPGPQFLVIGFLNSFVHIVMYFYYMIAAMGPKYQRFLWWKKYLTTLQLAQFCVMLCYLTMIALMDSKLPRSHTFFFITNVIIFLYLFGDFYRKEYNKKHHKKLVDKDTNANSIAQLTELKDMIDRNEKKVYFQNKTDKNDNQKMF
ncbi:elongation of very long chain fatty acids protein 7-like [Phlebotomus papatasi]|uniref:elongation of very long chain fatty acids protein 7-like n=1 Tax=Phlebotomus papatasi TaxID=29031 RepID=UPI0024842ACF|nr:elongation of very long chain fatty acids protein 7-like [Phlebotomus papatasi]